MNVQVKVKKVRAGKKRRMLGCTLLTLGVLVAGVWMASRWWTVAWSWTGGFIALGEGGAYLDKGVVGGDQGGWVGRQNRQPSWRWWFGWDPRGNGSSGGRDGFHRSLGVYQGIEVSIASKAHSFTRVLLWPIPLLLWTPAALLLRSGILARRRALKGMCGKCGYDLAGLPPSPDAACPECGKGRGTK